MRHLLNESELVQWMGEKWSQYAASGGEGTLKRLELNFDGLFRVIDRGEVVYLGDDRTAAILAYNDAP